MRFIFILLIYFRAETAINEGGNNNKIEEEGYEIERVRKLEDQTRNSKSGACGSELIYSISTDKLMITGSGDMFDYELIEEISSKEYSTTPWDFIKRNISIITISSTTTHIGSYAFYYFQELSTINLPTSLTSIGSYSFYGCSKLTNITIPTQVITIGSSSFSHCTNLKSIQEIIIQKTKKEIE